MSNKIGKKIMSWDLNEIMDRELEYRLENWEEFYEEKQTEDEIREDIISNDYEFEWGDLVNYLTEFMEKKNAGHYWKANVSNFGWRSLDGHKYFIAENGTEFLSALLPDTDCTFYIHNYGKGFAIQNYHHDSPTGNEWYYIMPVTEGTYYKGRDY